MAATGLAGFTVFGRSVVVRVDHEPLARVSLWVALAVLPVGLVMKWLASEDAAAAHAPWMYTASWAGAAVLMGLLVASMARGTARAQLFVENEPMDTLRWSTAPKRKLKTTLEDHSVEAQIDTSGDREIKLFVDGNLLHTVPVV